MYRGVCLYDKTRIFFGKNNSEKEKGQLVLTYMCMYAVCMTSGMPKSLYLWEPTVGVLMYLSASDFFFHVYRLRVVCGRLCVTSSF